MILPWLISLAFVNGIIKIVILHFTISLKVMVRLQISLLIITHSLTHRHTCTGVHTGAYMQTHTHTHLELQCINKINLLHAALITPCDQILLVATAAAQHFGNRTTPKGKGNMYILIMFLHILAIIYENSVVKNKDFP